MSPFVRFILYRLGSIPVTLFIVTAALYGFVMLTPPEVRVSLFMSPAYADAVEKGRLSQEQYARLIQMTIEEYHLNDPFPVQYAIWVGSLLQGQWGYSPVLQDYVLNAILRRMPVTLELTIYSILLFIPLGLLSGLLAGSRRGRRLDNNIRLTTFIATSMPPFITALILLAIFYVTLNWFAPERLGVTDALLVKSSEFKTYTGFLTIDGFLNGKLDISLEAARHLVMPVITLSLLHWATLTRVTRATLIDELQKDYVTAGRARGLSMGAVTWKHAFRNVLSPALTSSALSAASLFTGVFVVEALFNFKGVSDIAVISSRGIPDAVSVLGFAIYSVISVLAVMLVLDIAQSIFDPRLWKGLAEG